MNITRNRAGRKALCVAVASLAWLAPFAPHGRAAAADGPPAAVKTATGDVGGVSENGVLAFKGIPYAAPPVGDLRWRAPKPPAPWQGARAGGAFGPACIQIPGLSAENGGDPGALSEDCLYLNVWTPKTGAAAKLPVMVWIHGGAYIFGAGGLPIYDGSPMAKKGAVVVTLNYRLAQLGFFAHPALEKESPGGPANFGLLDQIAALKWVKQNIGAFGGDPRNVTILGQSAGAKSVLALFASPLARGLFHKGVAMSAYVIPDASRAKAVEAGVKVADALGLKGAAASAAELRAVPAERFGELKGKGLSVSPSPIKGDTALPRSIEDVFADADEAPVPLILGNASDDASVAVAFGFEPVDVLKRLGVAGFLVKALYPGVKDETELARKATSDLVFTMLARWVADRHARVAPVWRYYFDYVAEKDRDKFPFGAGHGYEVPFLLNTGDIYEGTKDIFTDADRALSRRANDYLVAFARDGAPSAPGGPDWPAHRRARDRAMSFGEPIKAEKNFMRTRMNVFIGVTKVIDAVLGRK